MTLRVLILGGDGMLGHKLWQVINQRYDTWVSLRKPFQMYSDLGLFDQDKTLHVNALDSDSVIQALNRLRPDCVINAIGLVKQREESKDTLRSLRINSVFPQRLAVLCEAIRARLVHVSTDCVFSGLEGCYTEQDTPDATDLYGRTKLLGEPDRPNCLTLRTSIIGRELQTQNGLVEWFLSQAGETVNGFTNAIFSGFPTVIVAEIIGRILAEHPEISGLYHLSSEPISKYDLLVLLNEFYSAGSTINPNPEVRIDRSLDSHAFRAKTGFTPKPWREMVRQMVDDPTPYPDWRS